ncbi:DUF3267 domain-containing protein [Clostridium tepidum]|uniref:DUF3267 domain-containing protein n=2 Tax=Clostridium tepidum TaxID=1962263 RepID=A0A1S9IAD9_9CLOT|nr:DUF3267 domain-containing protein [Clostridium tepidum]MDU6878314.1 DUF3267 domain-containing protein [Clostridium botulinum]OOO62167.1 hypothetical protein BS637_08595 [Clostridium tepidum]OOO67178.1 hypothetical protein BS638_05720 [Clostridium tepidum]
MRYTKKMPHTNKELSEKLISQGWTKLKEPNNLAIAILISTPFMIINAFISIFISYYLFHPLKEFLIDDKGFKIQFTIRPSILLYIVIIFLFMTLHEFIHGIFIPNVLKSDKTYWGINAFCGFVFTTEKIKKVRFIIISIMPFILLSIILPFILNVLGLLNWFTVLLCLINSMGSSVDLLNICLVALQVPKGSYIINNGFETYFS